MSDIHIRITGRAGRITLTRPKALNAMSYDMCNAIETALDDWRRDDAVDLVIIDAEGEKAFCAGGDIQELYDRGRAGDFAFGQTFWRDEYRLNAKIEEYPKPYIAFMQGFVMGGGVGISCHGSHRIVCESSQIAMPECGIGLVPDVGGSLILANAPGRLGEYLGTTGARMGPADAILTGFADSYVPHKAWTNLIARLETTGNPELINQAAVTAPEGTLAALRPMVDAAFDGSDLTAIVAALTDIDTTFSQSALKAMHRNSPVSMASAIDIIRTLRGTTANIRRALELEYRFTFRAMEHGDFLEGVRAAVIDKDRSPHWRHDLTALPQAAVAQMLASLGAKTLSFDQGDHT